MTANAVGNVAMSVPHRTPRRSRLRPGTVVVLLLTACTLVALYMPERAQHAATRACTVGNPHGTSCAASLMRLGYP